MCGHQAADETTAPRQLHACLSRLNSMSNTATRRLDDTYYSILEKVSALQATISSLQEVSSLTSQLQRTFEGEASDLEADVHAPVSDLQGFKAQRTKVAQLETRMHAGREKAAALVDRLQLVRERVKDCEQNELRWQARTSRESRPRATGSPPLLTRPGAQDV